MTKEKRQAILNDAQEIICKILPDLNGTVCEKNTPNEKCIILETSPEKVSPDGVYFHLCLFFINEIEIVPSIYFNAEGENSESLNSDPGNPINIDNLEEGLTEFMQKQRVF